MLMEDIMAHAPHAETSRPAGSGSLSPGFGATDFGAHHHHKPTKAIVGVAILVVLSFVFYELGGKTVVSHSSLIAAHQAVSSSNH
jgi:hypothetical protein